LRNDSQVWSLKKAGGRYDARIFRRDDRLPVHIKCQTYSRDNGHETAENPTAIPLLPNSLIGSWLPNFMLIGSVTTTGGLHEDHPRYRWRFRRPLECGIRRASVECVGRVGGVPQDLPYDALVLASGSHLVRPPLPGVVEFTFDVDTYDAALRLQAHIDGLASAPQRPGRFTALVVGSGATGVELACEADELAGSLPGEHDALGRVAVDEYMRVTGLDGVYAAGDVAHALIDGQHPSVMSCQHARPMGRFAGHNAVNGLFDQPLQGLNIDWYTNIIDLGPWGAVYLQSWDRAVVAEGTQAKNTKQTINRERIYPPRDGNRERIFAAAALDLQRPPVLKTLLAETDKSGESQ